MGLINDTKRLFLEKIAGFYFQRKQYKSALRKYLSLLEIAIKDDLLKEQAKYHKKAGDCYEKLDHRKKEDMDRDHEEAGEHYIKAAEKYSELGEHARAGEIYEHGASAFDEIGRFADAAKFYLKSAEMFEDIEDYFNASYSYETASKYYEKAREYEKAAKAYMQGGSLALKVRDKSNAATSFKKAAKCFEKENTWEDAVDAYADAVEIDSLLNEYLNVADDYENMAHCYSKLDNEEESLYYHRKAAQLREKGGELVNAATSYMETGEILEARQEYEKARKDYMRAMKIYRKENKLKKLGETLKRIGRCNSKLGDVFSAAKNHLESADSFKKSGKEKAGRKEYLTAAKYFTEYAQEKQEEGQLEVAAEAYMDAGYSYEKAGNYNVAAEQYLLQAEIGKQKEEIDEKEGYRKAADAYAKGGDLWRAGVAHQSNGDYDKAAEVFLEYAEKKESRGYLLEAGKGYMQSAQSYSHLGEDTKKKQMYEKAVNRLQRYIENLGEKKQLSGKKLLNMGLAYRYIGECEISSGNLRSAENHLSKALKNLKEGDARKELMNLTEALLNEVDGDKAIDHGDYEKAVSLLKSAKKTFTSLSEGDWSREYKRVLKKHAQRCSEKLKKIKLKPELSLDLDKRSFTFTDIPLIMNVSLENRGAHPLKNLSFLEHIPDSIKILHLPEKIDEIQPKEKIEKTIELRPSKPDFYRLKPIEVYFEDEDGNKYVKASNEVSVEVVERPPADYKNHRKAVKTYLKYGENQQKNGNFFHAGDGYREAANVYGKFNTDSQLGDYYLKAVKNYRRYVKEHQEDAESHDPTKVERLGEAYWLSGECNRKAGRLKNAREDYSNAAELYAETDNERWRNLATAFHSITDGKIYARQGRQADASKKINKGLESLDEAIKDGGFEDEFVKKLEEIEDEAKLLLKKGEERPTCRVDVEAPEKAKMNQEIEYQIRIGNKSGQDFRKLKIFVSTPNGFDTVKQPEGVDELKKGDKETRHLVIKALEGGSFDFKPVDVSYGVQDKRYTVGSNRVNLEVEKEEKKEEDSTKEESTRDGETGIDLVFDVPDTLPVNETINISGVLRNQGENRVHGLRLIEDTPSEVKVVEIQPREIEGLDSGQEKEVTVSLKTDRPGRYESGLVELFYRDQQGNRYFGSQDDYTLAFGVQEEKPEPGKTYIYEDGDVKEKRKNISDREEGICVVTSVNPDKIEDYKNAKFIWLTEVSGENTIPPSSLTSLSVRINDCIEEVDNKWVFIEDVNYLVENNKLGRVLKFIKNQRLRYLDT